MNKTIFNKKAQATLELTLSLIVILVFLMGAVVIFIWFNSSIVERQEAFQSTRLAAGQGSVNPDEEIYFYEPQPLKIKLFGSQ